jgi:hypothetical protein
MRHNEASVLGRFFKKEKPRIFLGVLAVAPRRDLKRHLDEWGMFGNADLDSALRESLTEIFSLAPMQSVDSPLSTDLVLDVVIPEFQSGDAWDVSMGDIGLPIFWRPKVTVASRLYYLKTKKTWATFSVTEKMKWSEYFGRVLTWRSFFRFRPMFDRKDVEYLLYQACGKLLTKMQKAI